jgi:hypothetical protein
MFNKCVHDYKISIKLRTHDREQRMSFTELRIAVVEAAAGALFGSGSQLESGGFLQMRVVANCLPCQRHLSIRDLRIRRIRRGVIGIMCMWMWM